ncbi:unnamed protein product [Penicillium olsonii]|uniref:FAD-binding PCMH-type domain-containing protein n=1 Tax=Penicillium olsonii TaxID=99116 RepID=A0A9W4I3N4_PENOL|nr:unnamed protein product [Penicillium olsonii]
MAMVTLDFLKVALRQKAIEMSSSERSLSEEQYNSGFEILMRGMEWISYRDFIVPQLSLLVASLVNSHGSISVLEIGPGGKSVVGYLPRHLRHNIERYVAFEPNNLFATSLEGWLSPAAKRESPLPGLQNPPEVRRLPFLPHHHQRSDRGPRESSNGEKFDIILFCHSMYSMRPKASFIEQAMKMLHERRGGGLVVVFHRDGTFRLDGLVCHRTSSFPTGAVCVTDNDDELDQFAAFIAGFLEADVEAGGGLQAEWRKTCRALGSRKKTSPNQLFFQSPSFMIAFNKNATALPELLAQVPSLKGDRLIKNREALLRHPASLLRPTDVQQLQECVQWALKHRLSLSVVGGGHSGHCLWSNVVGVDMSAFDQIHILPAEGDGDECNPDSDGLIIAGAGCTTEDIIRKAMAVGLTVPLGARPSVGAGLWLQGGIGHLARLYGLTCDAIVGAVMISVASSQVLCIGRVPQQERPAGAVVAENESDLLWGLRGAGTNFGIVVSVTFRAYVAPAYSIRNWHIPLNDPHEATLKIHNFNSLVAKNLPRGISADAYLYWDIGQLQLGITMFECSTIRLATELSLITDVRAVLGLEAECSVADGVGLFDAEMYISKMHGGHGSSKTSSFKRCLFLKDIGAPNTAAVLVAAIESRPTPLCYLHLLQGGGAVQDVAADMTAFGCRDWDFACVITGVWPRDQDGTEIAQAAVEWVYGVAKRLLPFSGGAYSADIGPDPRDLALAAKAFGPNRPRLRRLKQTSDPQNVLAHTCPLLDTRPGQRLIVLVTGDVCAGKDYCAGVWVSAITSCSHNSLAARSVSISDVTKREYAVATGADATRLCEDRAYKEQHRSALTAFFQNQVQHQPCLPEQHFLNLVENSTDVDVLFITGMRDEAPVAAFSHLVPDCRLVEVRVRASEKMQFHLSGSRAEGHSDANYEFNPPRPKLAALDHCPSLVFDNDTTGSDAATKFAEKRLLAFYEEDLQLLRNMARPVPDFPRAGITLHHVLNIPQQPGGLDLCTSLLQNHFTGDWAKINRIACCEAGAFVFASSLASRLNIPLALIREAGKLPPPTYSVPRSKSHISRLNPTKGSRIEMEKFLIPQNSSVLIVDDVLATGQTLLAVLYLLRIAGVQTQDISVIVVAEFPVHRARELLRRSGFGGVNIQSLLVFDGD